MVDICRLPVFDVPSLTRRRVKKSIAAVSREPLRTRDSGCGKDCLDIILISYSSIGDTGSTHQSPVTTGTD